jgi:ParB-like chromosome segregation protein Spo0J
MSINNNASTHFRDLAIEHRDLAALKTNPRNAHTHSKRQVKAIAESIRAFGFTNPILVDDEGMILPGHGRYQAAKLLGLDAVPAIRISQLSDAQKRAYVLADNKLAERAGWDRELLAVELGELSMMLPDLGLSVDLTDDHKSNDRKTASAGRCIFFGRHYGRQYSRRLPTCD